MKRSGSVRLVLMWLLAFAPLLVVLIAYRHLPARIPTHWNSDGTITYGDRGYILPLGAISVIVTALLFVTRRIDPRRENYGRFSGAYQTFILLFNVFMLAMTLFVITESLRPGTLDVQVFVTVAVGIMLAMTLFVITESLRPGTLDVQVFVTVAVGILLAVCGNLMPKFKHNYFIGIRTPWTLASETVWYRTHRLCGVLWVIGGLVIVLSAFLPAAASVPVLLAAIAVLVLVPYVMSYVFFRREQAGN
ncbi:SdpI family protein [Butyricicoccus sp.]|uniref:SdpI family protein n=1 Tax=Butyricicoccus sp. TaxID=2049021 RepID=UPI003F15658E